MIAFVTVGADDQDRAQVFNDAVLPALGYARTKGKDGLSYTLPLSSDVVPPDFYVKPTFNGAPAAPGNGTMIAFEARDQAQMRALHTSGLAAEGKHEGQPGFRASYGPRFYVAELRDPQGNNLASFFSPPDDPARGDAPEAATIAPSAAAR